MAEGFDFDNPAFNEGDYEDDDLDELEPSEEFQSIILVHTLVILEVVIQYRQRLSYAFAERRRYTSLYRVVIVEGFFQATQHRTMSKRADYDCISKVYDNNVVAVGSDVMCAFMQFHSGKALKDMHVLDAGCGSGNFAKALIQYGVGRITILDASSGMLEVAKVKLADDINAGTIKDLVNVSMPPIPFSDESFDAVMFNAVLNHLDNAGDDDYPRCIQTLKEARRVVRPGGVIFISTILKHNLQSVWFTHVDKTLGERCAQGMPSLQQFEEIFNAADISVMQKMNILGADVFPNYYKDPMSSFSYFLDYVNATDPERNTALKVIAGMEQRGELQEWIREHDGANTAGITTLLVCKARANKMIE